MKTETQPGLQLVITRQIKCAGMFPIDDVFIGSSWQAIDLQRNNFLEWSQGSTVPSRGIVLTV